MRDLGNHLPEGMHPLQSRVHRPKQPPQRPERTLPEVQIIVGRDLLSSGLTIYTYEETGGHWPRIQAIYAARWFAPVLTVEGALTQAARGAAAALAELFPDDVPE